MANLENSFTVLKVLVLLTIAAAVGFILKYYYSKRRIFRLGSKLPGPKPWPLIGNAWHFLGLDSDIISKLNKYRNFKKIFAVWLGHELNVFVHSPDFAEVMCKSPQVFNRSGKTRYLKFIAPTGIFFVNGAEWKKSRKFLDNALAYSLIKNSIQELQIQADVLAQRLQCEVGKPCIPIINYIQECVIDIICDISVEFELKAQKSEIPLFYDLSFVIRLVRERFYNIFYMFDFLYKLFPDGKQFYSIIHLLKEFTTDAIIKRQEKYMEEKRRQKSDENLQKPKRKKFWQLLLDDESLTVPDMRDHVISLIVAGYETTSNAVACAIVLLALDPVAQEKVYQEAISVPDGDFNDENLRLLEYLDMVIQETLRLYPTIPINFRTATGDIQIGEYLIPAGADVNLNIYELHRDPEQYDKPHEFYPEHFLPEKVAKRHPYAYIPYGSGLRNCVGGKLSTVVMKIIVCKLLLKYKLECDYKTIDDIKFRGDIAIGLNDGGRVRLLQRQ